ncbi:MAG: glycerol-3-phosphate dehydrogenase [Gammaproteobacteria bacterium]|nr:glycerol-3-phosphate dehydrogenase [Gammaproteobacteria bacterium]MCP4881581.1 glycerol-3-phosphate dehydrogenase [Gammaproteobacteria bacterium]MDP6165552.1 glycerol-3-phosphate dehydrogenase [Gammaproteobacteria bacterium]
MEKKSEVLDLLVVGGGVNGVGIALDAAGRGLSVSLCEMHDLGSATSSNSSKLIHGGLRYLEHYQFRLVREALAEREVLLAKAPHIMWPLRFRLPHRPHLRPLWMIRAGLFLYDHLSKLKNLKPSIGIKFNNTSPLRTEITRGFEYSDAWVDDARLVVLNAMAARDKGAKIHTYTRCVSAVRKNALWHVTLENQITGEQQVCTARVLVNAAGPWVVDFFQEALAAKAPKQIRLVKGSHIIVPKLHDEPEAYILQNADGRIVFVIPYEGEFSLIGTTDEEYNGAPDKSRISDQEIEYLISVTNSHFKQEIGKQDIVHTYSGVRPLIDDESVNAQAVTRDYSFEIDRPKKDAPLVSVFGGKITTYRKLAEAVVDAIAKLFDQAGEPWTHNAPLPGGEFTDPKQLGNELKGKFPWLPEMVIGRYVRCYGTLSYVLLENANSLASMGRDFGAGLFEKEVEYLVEHEWARSAEDIIWRRTKLGLFMQDAEIYELECFLKAIKPTRDITPESQVA